MPTVKILIAFLFLGATASISLAQGTVSFRNFDAFQTTDPTGGNRLVYDLGSPLNPATGIGLAGTQYVAELYAGFDASSLQPLSLSVSRFRSTTTANRGKWSVSTLWGLPNSSVVLPANFGDTVLLQVKWWNYDFGTTWENKTGGWYGLSLVFTYKVPPAGDLTPSDYFMEGFQAFAIVPEPSAIALAVLGAGGLLLLRRKRYSGCPNNSRSKLMSELSGVT